MTTMIRPLQRALAVGRSRPAVICDDTTFTYDEMERARRLVGGLRQLGLERGDRVAIIGRNCHRYLEIYQAIPIVTGGENVYSTEVEDVLYRHPMVLEAAVFGIPDQRWGEAVHAIVVPRRPCAELPDLGVELVDFCRSAIAGYKVPKRIEVRDEPLPKSGAGKLLKRELRAPFWADRDALVGGT